MAINNKDLWISDPLKFVSQVGFTLRGAGKRKLTVSSRLVRLFIFKDAISAPHSRYMRKRILLRIL